MCYTPFLQLNICFTLQVTGQTAPHARSYHTAASFLPANSLYVFGGCGQDGRMSDVWRFQNKTWTSLDVTYKDTDGNFIEGDCPIAGRGGALVLLNESGSHLLLFFGFCGSQLDDVWALNLSNMCWQRACCHNTPKARSVLYGARIGG